MNNKEIKSFLEGLKKYPYDLNKFGEVIYFEYNLKAYLKELKEQIKQEELNLKEVLK